MPQNITSYGATGSSVHHHTGWSSHHQPRSTSWQNGIIGAGCQATATCSVDGPPFHSPITASPLRPLNGTTLPVEAVKGARPSGSASINGVIVLHTVTKNCKANQRCPRRRLKNNRTSRKRRQNTEVEMSNLPVATHVEEDWESEYQEVLSSGSENTPYGPEDVSLFALKDVTREDAEVRAFCSFQPAHNHPDPVQWLRLRAPTEPEQFTDAD